MTPKRPSSTELQTAIQAALTKRDYKSALAAFDVLLKHSAVSTQIRMRHADTLMLAGRKADAVREYHRVAEEMAEGGYLVQAVAVYKKIVKLDPNTGDVIAKLARLDAERSSLSGSSATTSRAPITSPAARDEISEFGESEDLDIGADLGIQPQASLATAPAAEARRASPEAEPVPALSGHFGASIASDELSAEELSADELSADDLAGDDLAMDPAPDSPARSDDDVLGFLAEDIDSMLDGICGDLADETATASSSAGMASAETNIGLFTHLAVDELVEVLKLLEWQSVARGAVIVREGEPGLSMYIVSSGRVEASVTRAGVRQLIATLEEGSFFGEMAVLSGEPRAATVTAVDSTELLELSRERLLQLLSRHPEVEAKLRLAHEERKEQNRSLR